METTAAPQLETGTYEIRPRSLSKWFWLTALLVILGISGGSAQSVPVESTAADAAASASKGLGLKRRLTDGDKWEWGLKIGAGTQGIEAGIIRCNWRGVGFGMVALAATNEFTWGQTWLNPKLSAEVGWMFVAGRLSVVDYTDFKRQDVRLRPEIGLSLLGFGSLLYRYDVLFSETPFNIRRSGLSLTINFPFNPGNHSYF